MLLLREREDASRPRLSARALTPPARPKMQSFMQPQIILLREGTDTSQGKGQLISNINACIAVVDTVRTTLVRGRRRPALRPGI